jgi:hypothetical protein
VFAEAAVSPVEADETVAAPLAPSSNELPAPRPVREPAPAPAPMPEPPRASEPPPSRPAPPASVQAAIETVNDIIGALNSALKEMEDVLEGLEVIERQQTASDYELETLRRKLRHLHHPRGGGSHDRGHRHGDDPAPH